MHQPELYDSPNFYIDVEKIVDEINRRVGDPKNPAIIRAPSDQKGGGGWGGEAFLALHDRLEPSARGEGVI